MKKVLVTGAAGFVGSHVAEKLLERGDIVVGIDNFDDTYDRKFKEENLAVNAKSEGFNFIEGDICNQELIKSIFEREKPDSVLHLAARVDTRKAVDIPLDYIKVNIDGTIHLLDGAKNNNVSNFVFVSSSSVYGNSTKVPWSEESSADEPISPYGATKRAGELFAHSYHHNFDLNVTCLRYFNVYGERNRPTMVPYIWAEKILKGEEIEISGDGSRKRDYTYVGDIVNGTISAIDNPLQFEVINLGNNNPVSLNELLAVFEKVIGVKAKVKSRPSHKASVEETYADVRKAKKMFGWQPTTTIEEGVERLVTWFKGSRL